MAGDHGRGAKEINRAFAIGVALNVSFAACEAFFGFRANSLALLADAGHNLSDVLTLLLAWAAASLARRRPTARRTYGLRRSSTLAALVNAIVLLVVIGGLGWEAVRRLGEPQAVSAGTVAGVALAGVVINTATALLFRAGRKRDLNQRAAFLHMAADAGVSAAVLVAGLVLRATGWAWIDPAASLFVVVAIAAATWGLFRDSLDLALDAVPAGIDPAAVEASLRSLAGITAVHDLHIWGMSSTETALTVHLTKPDGRLDDDFLAEVARRLQQEFGIHHVTIQLERGVEHDCSL